MGSDRGHTGLEAVDLVTRLAWRTLRIVASVRWPRALHAARVGPDTPKGAERR
jgi:hypothetical protein